MSSVRVRFAPSPTGFFHIGSARTALFNWLYARHTGGMFILRIEDTDKERNSEQFLNVIYDSLSWLGMNWDEGPKVGGDFGPYRQSERADVYREYLEKLKAAGRTYEKDGAIWFKLLGERYEVFDEHRKKNVTKVKVAPTVIEDRIRGRVERIEDEDFVIFRSDGNPVFHFVNVVDDIAMQITHVIRGEDHLSNTSKHVELFKAFGAPVPQFAHIPLILKQNGPGKMSKRDQGALIEEYQRRGYVPEALVNFLSLLGWNPGDDREKLPIEEIVRLFDLPGVNQSNARFDDKKLAHMNMAYLLEMPAEKFVAKARDLFKAHAASPAIDAALAADQDYYRDQFLKAKKLKWLQVTSAGVENYLSIPELKASAVTLTNMKIIQGIEIADHAFALLLGLTRRIDLAMEWKRTETWNGREFRPLYELRDKTAVIVGVGGIGTQIAIRAKAFGMTVIGVDPKDIPINPYLDRTVYPDHLNDVLPEADVVFISVPHTPQTEKMIGAEQFAKMKQGAFFICVSRGKIYDAMVLVDALKSGHIQGAGVDVTDPEPLPQGHPLWKMDRVIITPHIAGRSDTEGPRYHEVFKENLVRFAQGEPLVHTVDKQKGY